MPGRGGMKAQWVLYSAPSAIHCLRTCLSDSESGSLAAAGGIRSLASSAKIRLTSSLSSGLPGTMGTAPEAAGFTASVAHVQAELGLPRLVVRAVALEAVPRQDRPDPARE